jgi:hypothetical protein
MVGGTDNVDAVVGLEAVEFVEKVGADLIVDYTVEVFKDEDARGETAGLGEDYRLLVLVRDSAWLQSCEATM